MEERLGSALRSGSTLRRSSGAGSTCTELVGGRSIHFPQARSNAQMLVVVVTDPSCTRFTFTVAELMSLRGSQVAIDREGSKEREERRGEERF